MGKRKTLEEFGKDLFKRWGNHITLCEDSVYLNNKTKIIVKCDKHGKISQTPDNLLKHDCKQCSIEKVANSHRDTKENFVEESNIVHNGKYSYEKFNYVNRLTKGIITCPIHGDFLQAPADHLQGRGCRKCANKIISNSRKDSFEDFEFKAIMRHGRKYKYHKDSYKDSITKTIITCPIHGDFPQVPSSHLMGAGCPFCRESKLEKEVNSFLVENKFNFVRQYREKWLGRQSLDFYLPDYNVAIECQGIQHFKQRKAFGGEEGLKLTKKRDKLKVKKCNKKGIKLLFYGNKKHCDSLIDNLTVLKNNILKY